MKSKIMLVLGLAALSTAAPALDVNSEAGRGNDSVHSPGLRSSKSGLDRNELRAAVDETQALLDSLARETLNLPKAEHEPLYKSLRDEYHLESYVGKGRKSLEQAEEVLELQNAIKSQQALMKAAGPVASDKDESKLIGLQSDLVSAVDSLRDTLRDVHKNSSEDVGRDFRNWIMVSEGLLRSRREDREAQAASAATPTAEALSAEQVLDAAPSPVSDTAAPARAAKP